MLLALTDEEMLQLINDNPNDVIRHYVNTWPDDSYMHPSLSTWPFVSVLGMHPLDTAPENWIYLANADGKLMCVYLPEIIEFIDAENSQPILK